MEKEVAEIAKALGVIAKSLKTLAKKAVRAATPLGATKVKTGRVAANAKSGDSGGKAAKTAGKRQAATVPDQVLKCIQKARKGVDVEGIQQKTGLNRQQVNNALYKLTKAGAIARMGRGIYTGAAKQPLAPATPPATKTKTKTKAPAKAPRKTKAAGKAAKAPRKPSRVKAVAAVIAPATEAPEPQAPQVKAEAAVPQANE